jgi:hypothetical protein
MKKIFFMVLICAIISHTDCLAKTHSAKTRVIVTTDGEIDDECSLVRFLLYSNEWDVEGIITTSSQYHWHGHKWAGDNWIDNVMSGYRMVYPNLIKHSKDYPSPDYLKSVSFLGNVDCEGEMEKVTPGSERIVKVLLDESDKRPVWVLAWGGTNTLARALKTIEENYPGKMKFVAAKLRLFLIWEQDDTYQSYIRKHWSQYNMLTIISDQFIALFYYWQKYLPQYEQTFLKGEWMKKNILDNHGPLCAAYRALDNGDFRSEGDSPAFIYLIPTGLETLNQPDYGGWGGRYVKVRENTWLDPVHEDGYMYPDGRWCGNTAWGRLRLKMDIPNDTLLTEYVKPIWRWIPAMQNDFAARADWCTKSFEDANHPPVVKIDCKNLVGAPRGKRLYFNADKSYDVDGDSLSFRWWQYVEAGTCRLPIAIDCKYTAHAIVTIPTDASKGSTVHLICEVTDNGSPRLTRYRRIVLRVQ